MVTPNTSFPFRIAVLIGAFILAGLSLGRADGPPESGPNVLFLSIDDLRPEIGSYGAAQMQTPQIDALAAKKANSYQ